MSRTDSLTRRQKQVLKAIYSSLKDSGYPPTLADLRDKLDVSSNQAVLDFLRLLEEKGFIKKEEGAARGLKILEKGYEVLGLEPVIPYVGISAAGPYTQAFEDVQWQSVGQVEITKDFLVKVKGDSMIGADIHDGDIVLVRETDEFKNGDIVLARNDDETTIKRFVHDNGKVYLKPENPVYPNTPIYPDTRLIGKIVQIIEQKRRFRTDKISSSYTKGITDFLTQPSLFRLSEKDLPTRKEAFLKSLSSPTGKTKYKRYDGSPLRYAGGKSLAVGLIVELIPGSVRQVVSPFLGGGSVEIACANGLGLPVIAYDIFDILMNYWDVQLHEPEELYKRLLKFEPTRECFKAVKARLNKHWKGEERLSKLDLAAYYYFNSNTSYGPHFLGWPSSVYLQPMRYEKMIEKVRNFHAENLQVGCESFENVIPKFQNDFLYCDPPYYLGGDSTTFIGMYPHRNFPIHHKGFKHELLRDQLKEHRGGFILSYNNCSTIREWYKEYNMITPSWQYTFSQGDTRIGKNRRENNNGSYIKRSHELIIWKFPK